MNSTLRIILIIVNTLALTASMLWFFYKPDYEPIISCLVLFATLIGLGTTNSNKRKSFKQRQKGGDDSTNYQAGRDIKI
jgi:hypothetical protein